MKVKAITTVLFLLFILLECGNTELNQTTNQTNNQTTIKTTNQTTIQTTNQTTNQTGDIKELEIQQFPYPSMLIELDKFYEQELAINQLFTQIYRIQITEDKVKALNQTKWFLFIEIETLEEFQWQRTWIELFSLNKNSYFQVLKFCDSENGLDSCFLTNKNFNYLNQSIYARVTCQEYCKFKISAEISAKFKLSLNTQIELDFQNTAYSKLFTLDTSQLYDFKRLQIILKPRGFLNFNAPFRMYASKGEIVPTKQNHDFEGIHLWDDGLGIFINYPVAAGLFTILIEGPQKNVLLLQTKIINQTKAIKTIKNKPYFAYLQAQQKQLFEIQVNKLQKTYIKLTTLSGSVELSKLKNDKQIDLKFQFYPLARTISEIEYKFEPQFYEINKQFNITDKIYVEIKSNKLSTFIFQSYTNNNQINYILSQVNRYSDLKPAAADMYYLKLTQYKENINLKNKMAQIEVMTTTFDSVDLGTKFYLCRAQEPNECQPSTIEIKKVSGNESIDNEKRKEIKNVTKDSSVVGVRYYDLSVDFTDFLQKDELYYVYVIIVIINPNANSSIFYTLQYINIGSTYFLKQKNLKRDRISIDEYKYYTFINNDKDVNQIRVHSVQISGDIIMTGYKSDPRYNQVEGKEIYQYHGSVNFLNVKLGEQVYIVVQGIQNAYYSLYLQLIRQSEKNPRDKGNQSYNEIVLEDGILYDFFIKPQENIIFQIHSSQSLFELSLKSNLPLEYCLTENMKNPPFKPNCQVSLSDDKKQKLDVRLEKGLVANVGVSNRNNKSAELKIKMTQRSHLKNGSEELECTNSCPGMMNKFSLSENNLTKKYTVCYKLNFNRREDAEIIFELDNFLYQSTTVIWQLNNKQKQLMMDIRHLIRKRQLIKVCGSSQKQKCELLITIESSFKTEGVLVVQYLDKDMILLDGIAQPKIVDLSQIKTVYFHYQFINMIQTTIVLEGKVTNFFFYGKIVPKRQFMKSQNRSLVYPTQSDYMIKSSNPFFMTYQIYIINETEMKNFSCKEQCLLLISVVSQSQTNNKEAGRFVIEVSQQDRFLKENQPVLGYLQRDSIAFYQYYSPRNGTIFVQLNNQNMKCANILIKKSNLTRATPATYDKIAQRANYLILQNAQNGSYAISVQALRLGCSYTIQVWSSIVFVTKLKQNVFFDKTFELNNTYHFIYQHYHNESFKVLALNKQGQLMINLKVLYEKELNQLLQVNDSQKLKNYLKNITYQQKGLDFVKVEKQKLYFCTKCSYLITITANKHTETSIIVPSNNDQIPIITNALIKDQIKTNQTMRYRIFTSNLAKYQLHVQYGALNLKIIQSSSQKVLLDKIYNQTKQPIYQVFNSSNTSEQTSNHSIRYSNFNIYSIIQIKGIANSSMYSFEVLSENDVKEGFVKYGIPTYIFLVSNNSKCLNGTISDNREEFVLSFDDTNSSLVKNLQIQCRVDNKTVQQIRNQGINQMTVEIKNLNLSKPANYEICFKSKVSLGLTFIQSAHLMMLPSDTSVLFTHQTNFTFVSKGNTVLEVDECNTKRSVISISSNFNDLHSSGSSQIQQVRRANNLIQFNYWGPVYVHVETEGIRTRWRHKNLYTEIGMGYDKFLGKNAQAFKDGNSIKIQAKPIEQVGSYSKSAMKILYISYKILLARNEKQMLNLLNCQEKDAPKVQFQAQNLNQSAIATFPITEDMKNRFSEAKFFLVGVIVNLNIDVKGVIEIYRFIYPMVEIQREVFYGGNVRPIEISNNGSNSLTQESSSLQYLLVLVGLILLVLVSYCIYKKCLGNLLRIYLRKRNQKLSKQGSQTFKYTEFATIE